jgi:hypothetical protein
LNHQYAQIKIADKVDGLKLQILEETCTFTARRYAAEIRKFFEQKDSATLACILSDSEICQESVLENASFQLVIADILCEQPYEPLPAAERLALQIADGAISTQCLPLFKSCLQSCFTQSNAQLLRRLYTLFDSRLLQPIEFDQVTAHALQKIKNPSDFYFLLDVAQHSSKLRQTLAQNLFHIHNNAQCFLVQTLQCGLTLLEISQLLDLEEELQAAHETIGEVLRNVNSSLTKSYELEAIQLRFARDAVNKLETFELSKAEAQYLTEHISVAVIQSLSFIETREDLLSSLRVNRSSSSVSSVLRRL